MANNHQMIIRNHQVRFLERWPRTMALKLISFMFILDKHYPPIYSNIPHIIMILLIFSYTKYPFRIHQLIALSFSFLY